MKRLAGVFGFILVSFGIFFEEVLGGFYVYSYINIGLIIFGFIWVLYGVMYISRDVLVLYIGFIIGFVVFYTGLVLVSCRISFIDGFICAHL